jgi:hypothetical protein
MREALRWPERRRGWRGREKGETRKEGGATTREKRTTGVGSARGRQGGK